MPVPIHLNNLPLSFWGEENGHFSEDIADHVIDWKEERKIWAEFEKSLARKSPGRLKSSFVAKSVAICVVVAVALLAGGGCGFRTLRKDIEQVAEQALLEGHARVRGTEGNPIVIVVYSVTAKQIADLFLLPRPGNPFLRRLNSCYLSSVLKRSGLLWYDFRILN